MPIFMSIKAFASYEAICSGGVLCGLLKLGAMDTIFFAEGVAQDVTPACQAHCSCFIDPFVHLIFVTEEAVAAKDVASCKGGGGSVDVPLANWF